MVFLRSPIALRYGIENFDNQNSFGDKCNINHVLGGPNRIETIFGFTATIGHDAAIVFGGDFKSVAKRMQGK